MSSVKTLSWRCGARTFFCGPRALIAGVLNVTPDSFSDGGRFFRTEDAVRRARQMAEEGADFIDVGGESSRPGSVRLGTQEELRRVLPVIEEVRAMMDVAISVDTARAEVARAAIERGAEIVNDITALRGDPEMGRVVADSGAGLILMHMQGTPETMQENPRYDDVVAEVEAFLEERIQTAEDAGIERERLCIDPGIGFGKTLDHNLALIAAAGRLRRLGVPVLLGASRKSFIGALLDLPADERLEGSLAAAVVGVLQGADVVRVHDVQATRRAVAIADALRPHCGGGET